MNKLETRVKDLEQARQPLHTALIARFEQLMHRCERLPDDMVGLRLGEFMDTCSDSELEVLLEHSGQQLIVGEKVL